MNKLFGDVDAADCRKVDLILNLVSRNESEIKDGLKNHLHKHCQMESKLRSMSKVMLILNDVNEDSNKLDMQIVRTAQLVESVSAKVRILDLAKSRVSECQQCVHDLIDLQLCSEAVVTAIANEDFEIGASYVNRFLVMDLKRLKRTASDVQGSISSLNKAIRTLEDATVEMRRIVVHRFNDAVKNDDLESVERFFKIFPLLRLHEEGIEKFSNYICAKLSIKIMKELHNTADAAKVEKRVSFTFADALTSLLENFARAIEVNKQIVQSCYGFGYLLNMLQILQHWCDSDVEKLLLEFYKKRKILLKIQQINEETCRSPRSSIGKLNPKDIDALIAEIIVMHSRAELYIRFMKRRITADLESSSLDKILQFNKLEMMTQLFYQSSLNRQIQELLGKYILLERYFMKENVVKAIIWDTYDSGQLCSSMVDEVFFVLRKSIRRSLSSRSVNGTCAVINNAVACLYSDFLNAIRAPLKLGYSSGYIDLVQAYNVIQNTIQQGRIQANDNEKARMHFLIQLNNADIATEYIETLRQTVEQEIIDGFPALTSTEEQLIENCLTELNTFKDNLKSCIDFGMQQLRSSAIRPRLYPWVDQFQNYKHNLTEDELASYHAGETFVQFLIIQIDGLLNSFKKLLTQRNSDTLISIITTELMVRLEKVVKQSSFNRLGGLVLDQEVRILSAYLTSATSWSIRDKMIRLTQIATILNLENISELNDYWKIEDRSQLSPWRLTPTEIRTILTLRADFRMEDIKRIRL